MDVKRLLELTRDYEPADIWNMDEADCFFKVLPENGLAQKNSRGGTKSNIRLTISFFGNAAREKVAEPISQIEKS